MLTMMQLCFALMFGYIFRILVVLIFINIVSWEAYTFRPLAGYGLPPPPQGEFCGPYLS